MTPDDTDDDRTAPGDGFIDRLLELVATIEEMDGDRASGSGRIERSNGTIDFEYDVSVGLGGDDRSRWSPATDPRAGRANQARDDGSDAMGGPDATNGTDAILAQVRTGDERTVVTADLPAATATVDLVDPTTLAIASGTAEERVDLDRPAAEISDRTVANRVLTVELAPEGDR